MRETFAFLFDSNAPGLSSFYGGSCDRLFFEALLHADAKGEVRTRVCRGDVILQSMTGYAISVSMRTRFRQHEFADDADLRISLAVELAALFVKRSPSLDLYEIAASLLTKNIYVITCGTLPAEIADATDRELRPSAAYVAMTRIDMTSVIERSLFVEYVFRDMAVVGRDLLVAITSEEDSKLLGPHRKASFRSIVLLPENEFEETAPPLPSPPAPKLADSLVDIVRRKKRKSVRAGLLMRLMRMHDVTGTIDLGHSDESGVHVPESKLARYSLDENHSKGRDHAELFRRLLGLDANEWRFLRAQLEKAIETAEPENWRIEHDGVKFDALLPVVGRNGRSMTVRTGWIVRRNEPPQLTTAYIAKEEEQDGRAGTAPPVVDRELAGADRWSAIYVLARAAGEKAARECVPTPMFLELSVGHRFVEVEGACGGAAVILPDGRSSFARWLRKHGFASRFYPSGYAAWARVQSQSMERARAYAEAMARVFEANGIACRVHTYID